MTNTTPTDPVVPDELREAIMRFDLSRARTGVRAVKNMISLEEVDAEFERDIAKLEAAIAQYVRQEKLKRQLQAESICGCPMCEYHKKDYVLCETQLTATPHEGEETV